MKNEDYPIRLILDQNLIKPCPSHLPTFVIGMDSISSIQKLIVSFTSFGACNHLWVAMETNNKLTMGGNLQSLMGSNGPDRVGSESN